MKRMLTTGEVGHYCGVHFRTVSRWIAQGMLKAHRLPGGRGDYRVQVDDFLVFLRQHRLPVPEEFASRAGRVLVVEGDAALAKKIEVTLRRGGFETRIAGGELQAGAMLREFSPAVMTLDITAASGDGLSALRYLRSTPELSATRVLVVARSGAHEIARLLDEGATDVLPKPFTPRELLRRVSTLAGGMPTARGRIAP